MHNAARHAGAEVTVYIETTEALVRIEVNDRGPGFDATDELRLIGYSTDAPEATIRAFRHRFRGMEGMELDAEDLRILHALARAIVAGSH